MSFQLKVLKYDRLDSLLKKKVLTILALILEISEVV